MDSSCPFLLRVIDQLALGGAVQTPHDDSLDEADGAINVVVFDSRDQDFFTLL